MPFPDVPTATKNQIRAAGNTLRDETEYIGQAENARRLLSEWRACHLLPLNLLADDLQNRLLRLGVNGIVALRLKRLFRIVEKLREQPTMNATSMQDIAGLRAIVPTVDDVSLIASDYIKHPCAFAEVRHVTDYVANPKANGYRSIHLALHYKGLQASPYDGLRLELQLRSKLQHLWASAVEITGMWTGERIKYDEGEPEWQDFFQLVAEMVARSETTAPIEMYSEATDEVVRDHLVKLEGDLDAVNVLRNGRPALPVVEIGSGEEKPYLKTLLLEPDIKANRLSIRSYTSEQQEEALLAYAEAEQQVTFSEKSLAPVLVCVRATDGLREAYRSFFMDIVPFTTLVENFVGKDSLA